MTSVLTYFTPLGRGSRSGVSLPKSKKASWCFLEVGVVLGTSTHEFFSLSAVSLTILTWTNYFYQVLGLLPLWMTREHVKGTMPDKFKLDCPQVRVIIDCTEIRCEAASSLSLESETFSNYKNHTTFKRSDWHRSMWGYHICIQTAHRLHFRQK